MPTWMIAEDEPDIYEVLLAMFGIWEIEGIAFVDGEGAIAWIDDIDNGHVQGELPEFALLDIRLPGEIDGIMVAQRIRQSQRLRHIAVVLNTAYRMAPDEQAAVIRDTQVDAFWNKPLPPFDVLKEMIEKVIAGRRPPQRGAK